MITTIANIHPHTWLQNIFFLAGEDFKLIYSQELMFIYLAFLGLSCGTGA